MKAMDALLKESGAVFEARSGNASRMYRLPNGRTFARSHAPKGRTAMNEYKTLQKLLQTETREPA